MSFFYDAERIVRKYQHKIVLPEGTDIRIIGAASRLKNNGILEPIVLGKKEEVMQLAKENGIDAERLQVIDPDAYEEKEELIKAFVERRKGKITRPPVAPASCCRTTPAAVRRSWPRPGTCAPRWARGSLRRLR